MQFKVLEERLKTSNGNSRFASEGRTISNGSSRRQSLGGAENYPPMGIYQRELQIHIMGFSDQTVLAHY